MRRALVILLGVLASPALAAPPAYVFDWPVINPTTPGGYRIWSTTSNDLVTMFGLHFVLIAPPCDVGVWQSVAVLPDGIPTLTVGPIPNNVTLRISGRGGVIGDGGTQTQYFACQ